MMHSRCSPSLGPPALVERNHHRVPAATAEDAGRGCTQRLPQDARLQLQTANVFRRLLRADS